MERAFGRSQKSAWSVVPVRGYDAEGATVPPAVLVFFDGGRAARSVADAPVATDRWTLTVKEAGCPNRLFVLNGTRVTIRRRVAIERASSDQPELVDSRSSPRSPPLDSLSPPPPLSPPLLSPNRKVLITPSEALLLVWRRRHCRLARSRT